MATQLTAACADREGYLAKRGGWTDAGDNDGIRISVSVTYRALDNLRNETSLDDEV